MPTKFCVFLRHCAFTMDFEKNKTAGGECCSTDKPEAEEEEDVVTKLIGKFGRYQLQNVFLCSMISMFVAWHMMVISFMAPGLDHWCAPTEEHSNLTVAEWKHLAIPNDTKGKYEKCKTYDGYCDSFQYDNSQWETTIEDEWDLVCDRTWLAKTAQGIYNVGIGLGAFLFGILGDKIGRKKGLMVGFVISMVSGVGTALSNNLYMFFVTRFFEAIGSSGAFTIGFVMAVEFVGGIWIVLVGIGIEFPWAIGYMALTGIAYGIPQWRNLQWAITAPVVFYLTYYWILDESPRWLISQGREEEARVILEKAAKKNKMFYDPSIQLREQKPIEAETKQKASLIDLFRYPNLRRRTICLYYIWFVNAFVYYGLSLNTGDLGGDYFVNFFLSGAMELLAYIVSIFLLIKLGRRMPCCVSMLLGGAACMMTLAFTKGAYPGDWPKVVCANIGKFGISISFATVYLYTTEVYPTVARSAGLGSCSLGGRIGSILAPYVGLLKVYDENLPLILFGTSSVVAGLLVLLLPDTKDAILPETIEDGENFGMKLKDKKSLEPS